MMRLTVNGDTLEHAGTPSIKALLDARGIPAEHVALAINGEVAPRSTWPERTLVENDRIEILSLAGGG